MATDYTSYNYTENGRIYPFDDVFVVKSMFASELLGWGDNASGQLGTNDNVTRSTPRQEFTSSTNWKQVSSTTTHVAAIKTDGTLWTWGDNGNGQLGVNDLATRSTPVQEFTSSTNWKQVSGGGGFVAAIKTDGTLWAWGNNGSGRLGDNTAASRSTPVQEFTSSTNWKQVDCGGSHTAAIKTDGTLWLWGLNSSNQLGDNTTANRSTPRQEFTSSTNWKQVDCGGTHTAAIKTDGTLWLWGSNNFGQLGVNDTSNRNTPVQEFTSSTNWKQVSGGNAHTLAIKTNGTLWAWGLNGNGQLGDNTRSSRSTPRQEFTSSTNWKQVDCGGSHTAAVKTDGSLWSWGKNSHGELGINVQSILNERSAPVREFTSSTNWKQVSASTDFTVAVKTSEYPILY